MGVYIKMILLLIQKYACEGRGINLDSIQKMVRKSDLNFSRYFWEGIIKKTDRSALFLMKIV